MEYGDWCLVESVPHAGAGNIVKAVLEDAGIPVYVRCHEVPYYAGVMGDVGASEWGDVLVPAGFVVRARECLHAYFESLDEV